MNDPLLLTPAAQVLAGLLLLLFGRKMFWLFVALIGFFVGAQAGARMFAEMDDWALLFVSLGVGAICAGLAVVLQRLAVTIAGGIAGGMLAIRLAPLVGLHTDPGTLVAFAAGALLAAVLINVVFDPAVIVISALTGAVMVVEAFPLDSEVELLAMVGLVVVGIIVQVRGMLPRAV